MDLGGSVQSCPLPGFTDPNALGFALAVPLGLAQAGGPFWFSVPAKMFCTIIRGTPLLLQLWLLYYGLGSIFFITGVYNTTTANLVFILAFNTVFAALLSWLFLKERPRLGTMIAMLAMIIGVLIIVGGSVGTGHLFGDFMALCSAFFVALAITISRASGKDMGFTALVGVIVPLAVAAFMVAGEGLHVNAPWWIIFNGAVIMPISFFCLANGPKYISGPEVAMFYLLETVLAPVWVWLIFAEAPTHNSMIGGAILIVTLVAHSLWQLHEGRKRRADLAVHHPA